MNRPIFLTRTQRVMPRLKRVLLALVVFGCFVFYGVLIGLGVSS